MRGVERRAAGRGRRARPAAKRRTPCAAGERQGRRLRNGPRGHAVAASEAWAHQPAQHKSRPMDIGGPALETDGGCQSFRVYLHIDPSSTSSNSYMPPLPLRFPPVPPSPSAIQSESSVHVSRFSSPPDRWLRFPHPHTHHRWLVRRHMSRPPPRASGTLDGGDGPAFPPGPLGRWPPWSAR